MDRRLENFLTIQYNKIVTEGVDTTAYAFLYTDFANEQLRIVFSVLHGNIISLFKCMNQRLPTRENEAHFWADPSRKLLETINNTLKLYERLKGSELEFSIEEEYYKIFIFCMGFLKASCGSPIPAYTNEIEIYETIAIFVPKDVVEIKRETNIFPFNLKLIGEGSYAKVFKYYDDFYNRKYVLKRAKPDLTTKELARFKREFEEMKEFSSPYIVEVYNFDELKHQYVMEFMDTTLYKYIQAENSKFTISQRKYLINQILRAFQYIHLKDRLHRDISPNNILIKKYDDATVIKVSDFGLVKTPSSELTSTNTDFKGWFNDPALRIEGFYNYTLLHETYALTLIIYFVLTGKTSIANIKNEQIRTFVDKGTNADKTKRFQNIDEIMKAIGAL